MVWDVTRMLNGLQSMIATKCAYARARVYVCVQSTFVTQSANNFSHYFCT